MTAGQEVGVLVGVYDAEFVGDRVMLAIWLEKDEYALPFSTD